MPTLFSPPTSWAAADVPKASSPWFRRIALFAVLVLGLAAVGVVVYWPASKATPVTVGRSNGTEIWIDPPSVGKQHVFGRELLPAWLRARLPFVIQRSRFFNFDVAQTISTDRDDLVISLRGYNRLLGEPVDVQDFAVGIRAANGDIYPAIGRWAMGGVNGMMRSSVSFPGWPRGERTFHFILMPWSRGKGPKEASLEVDIPNPSFREAAEPSWSAQPLPASLATNGVEIRLVRLEHYTNGGPGIYWEIPSVHWRPVFELWRNGQLDPDWELASWEAVAQSGNRGQKLGLHETPLQIDGQWFRRGAASVLATDRLWSFTNLSFPLPTNGTAMEIAAEGLGYPVVVAGLFPAGDHTFENGQYKVGPPERCVGCAGWMNRQTVSRTGVTNESTINPLNDVLILRSRDFSTDTRLIGRLTDSAGQVHVGEAKTGWTPGGPGERLVARDFTNRIAAGPARLELIVQPELRARFVVRPTLP